MSESVFDIHVLAGLYNGFGWLAIGRVLGVGARFGTYELLTAFYKGGLFIFYALYLLVSRVTFYCL